ncbi:signal peptidase I [Erythrobacter litoralis]|uniref:signal peptidase I n=1 Tax=Erythrobacter litoralis TaxID=39960 RepID=UPI00243495DF|nr:signal peptidase I [Erythrobacter litoralis]MDG6078511.1 signal peptidase I [Erythrobacter litoralis]
MTDQALANNAPSKDDEAKEEDWGDFARFLIKLVLAVVIFRSFIFSPFTIPSESMLPGLRNGDYLVAAKWPYGYSRLSLPFELPLIPGRIFASLPERGDVVIFKHPVDGTDYVKRVIGLPGDTVAMRSGQVILNGEPLPKEPAAPFLLAMSANTDCEPRGGTVVETAEGPACRYRQFIETLPSGKSYPTLDFGAMQQDDFAPQIVPEGRMFVMGDNRDNSMDSRFPSYAGGGVGLVDTDLLVGRASMVLWSTDGSAEWLLPWTWFTAARWDRIGSAI